MPSFPAVDRAARALAVGALLVVAACVGAPSNSPDRSSVPTGSPSAAPSGSASAPHIPHPNGSTDIVIRVDVVGGFIGPAATLTSYPLVSVYGDGSVITVGPQDAIYPGPMLPNLLVRRLSESGVQRLLELARAAGLFELNGSFDATGIADAGTTRLTIVTDGVHTVSAYALGEASDENGPTATRAARQAIRAFVARLTDLTATLGPLEAERPYDETAIRLLVSAQPPAAEPGLQQRPLDWPLASPLRAFGSPFDGFGSGFARCGSVSGSDRATLRPLLQQANILTPWRSAGSSFGLLAHPLLPDEPECPPAR